jgi:hypothetical protein
VQHDFPVVGISLSHFRNERISPLFATPEPWRSGLFHLVGRDSVEPNAAESALSDDLSKAGKDIK